MKIRIKTCLLIFGSLVFIGFGWLAYKHIFPIAMFFHKVEKDMKKGRIYMDSLTEKDIQVWITRTKQYLEGDHHPEDSIGDNPVPLELKELGIIRIDGTTNMVRYMWVGGIDHTGLEVERLPDNTFQIYAGYNDNEGKVIWPKKTNTALLK